MLVAVPLPVVAARAPARGQPPRGVAPPPAGPEGPGGPRPERGGVVAFLPDGPPNAAPADPADAATGTAAPQGILPVAAGPGDLAGPDVAQGAIPAPAAGSPEPPLSITPAALRIVPRGPARGRAIAPGETAELPRARPGLGAGELIDEVHALEGGSLETSLFRLLDQIGLGEVIDARPIDATTVGAIAAGLVAMEAMRRWWRRRPDGEDDLAPHGRGPALHPLL